ncbi:MAG TPA: MlaD family protein [Myxococcaceae bacterium]|nr:MlaD family protein [Myxococcaceae bacterium]
MKTFVTPFRVGIFVLASVAFLAGFLLLLKRGGLGGGGTMHVVAYFRDASGLGKRSRVQTAGIPVGEISDIVLEGDRAKLTLKVRTDLGLRENASILKRSESFLGDYLLDIQPGSPPAPLLEEGGVIRNVVDAQGVQSLFDSLALITGDIQSVTRTLRDTLGGDAGQASLQTIVRNLTELSTLVENTARNSQSSISAILENVRQVSGDVRSATRGQDANVREIMENVRTITSDVRTLISEVKGTVQGTQREGASIESTLTKLDRTLENLAQVTQDIRDGKGPLGKLIEDERTGQQVNEAVQGASEYVYRLSSLKTELSLSSVYLFNQGSARNEIDLKIIPRPDKYYLIGLVDDPRGDVNVQYVVRNPPGLYEPAVQKLTVTDYSLKFNAEFAKRYYFATFRFGIIESTGGVGVDLSFFDDSLVFKTDIFNFGNQALRYPRLRITANFTMFQHLFLSGGVDDMFNPPVRNSLDNRLIYGRDFFFGAGIVFTDDDLKAILTVAPVRAP